MSSFRRDRVWTRIHKGFTLKAEPVRSGILSSRLQTVQTRPAYVLKEVSVSLCLELGDPTYFLSVDSPAGIWDCWDAGVLGALQAHSGEGTEKERTMGALLGPPELGCKGKRAAW